MSDVERSRRFYDAALRPLGLVRIVDFGDGRGSDYGAAPGSPGVEFTITRAAEVRAPIPGVHLCFRAPDRNAVDAFHAAALAAGGRDDGAPGLRPHYHADYYGAFVLDPDGHRIEAVCHAPERPMIIAAGYRPGTRAGIVAANWHPLIHSDDVPASGLAQQRRRRGRAP